ncbi:MULTISPECIES: 7-carboxy-7-deazaguanine synthase QueE [Rhodobacterales]|jgi:7-carboxy-7-deazaguanine synthase|uniref:7-carboxy-7-deazaguanine synthase QueE n=1 Tax=Rhodobacterales TaxID=204455 RepID=UPI00237F4A42|nr:7-carboxy-7-deazaguanine synthase QueE [Phaeobacter gallaeciensis]MDE4098663.1 7-carboxy-7-deazaguanine synthase QueE [Phaeobacter gallaeciensis]MDE4107580.1 7-carboxy-7-deazaguanine synthase QueE [Phaeobacter gallaeciensis]MDE4112034.1 7-carboxy-7-deazaguanine synthase QueE [Phaeobacter gallaeciensis]MDE4116398.1 7-carboxy-7-deazaguanine synthase QueE [Phaeobacter gallaeciensis]MDE4120869.1 7-carboxy-7-deazaguanine synthase QueE [Phaeobacter gallaeciensis]
MTLRIAEIFGPTIQGEGALIGEPTVFVRAGGCDYRCSWCDSLHAVDSAYRHTWTPMSDAEIWGEVLRLSGGQALTVSLSGGNPAIQDFGPLIARGRAAGYRFACETQGSVSRPWFGDLDTLVLSPKPPSSGESVDWAAFTACVKAGQSARQVVMKIVIFDEADYSWAKEAHARHPDLPIYLQPGNPDVDPESPVDPQDLADRLEWLNERAMTDGWFAPRILPQLHVLIWGNKRGV